MRQTPARLAAAMLAAAMFAGPATAEPARFDTPEAAAAALEAAVRAHDRAAGLTVFGPETEDILFTGDPAEDHANWDAVAAAWSEMSRVGVEADGVATLYLGRDQWPFPAPIVRGPDGRWAFDAEAARDEVRLRRIGRNELDVMEAMRAYVAAQARYRAMDPDGDGVAAFAAHLVSAEGARDGLYWPDAPGAPQSPVGDLVARAAADGVVIDGRDESPEPFLGYYFRILTRAGPAAPGGAVDWMTGGRLLGGHALLAVPADPGESGVMSFLIAETGALWEADLGPDTLEVAAGIDALDPGEGWARVE